MRKTMKLTTTTVPMYHNNPGCIANGNIVGVRKKFTKISH
jgi:hypothetical protein